MPTERMAEVEVVCWRCNGSGVEDYKTDPPTACWGCDRTKQRTALVPTGSLTAARLRLADAEVARRQFSAKCAEDTEFWPPDVIERYAELSDAVVSAYAVVIAFGSAALRTARGNNKGTNDD